MFNQVFLSSLWQTVGVIIAIITTATGIIVWINKLQKSPKVKLLLNLITICSAVLLIAGTGWGSYVFSQPTQSFTPSPTTTPISTVASLSPTSSNTTMPNTTPTPTTLYPPIGWKITLSDPLNKEPSYWQKGSDANTGSSCQFSNGAYHIQAKNINYFCTGPAPVFKDVVFEVSMTIIKGNCGGIWFRGNYAAATPAYFFQVCQDQSYGLFLYSASSITPLVPMTSSSAIHAGLNQSNLIAVVTIGNHFDLYVNQQKINSVNDSTLSSGQINIAAVAGNDLAEVVYQDAKVWTLSGS